MWEYQDLRVYWVHFQARNLYRSKLKFFYWSFPFSSLKNGNKIRVYANNFRFKVTANKSTCLLLVLIFLTVLHIYDQLNHTSCAWKQTVRTCQNFIVSLVCLEGPVPVSVRCLATSHLSVGFCEPWPCLSTHACKDTHIQLTASTYSL
jgi:hypothetical protein